MGIKPAFEIKTMAGLQCNVDFRETKEILNADERPTTSNMSTKEGLLAKMNLDPQLNGLRVLTHASSSSH